MQNCNNQFLQPLIENHVIILFNIIRHKDNSNNYGTYISMHDVGVNMLFVKYMLVFIFILT